MWSISQGKPQECMGATARTRGLSTFRACSTLNVAVRGSMSTNTGTRPKNRIVVIAPKKVQEGTMISLPGGRSSAKYIDSSAPVPFMCVLAKGTPLYCRHLASSSCSGR